MSNLGITCIKNFLKGKKVHLCQCVDCVTKVGNQSTSLDALVAKSQFPRKDHNNIPAKEDLY